MMRVILPVLLNFSLLLTHILFSRLFLEISRIVSQSETDPISLSLIQCNISHSRTFFNVFSFSPKRH